MTSAAPVSAHREVANPLVAPAASARRARASCRRCFRGACFLPAHTARQRFDEILANFREARGPLFEKGLVFREFVPLRRLGEDMRGMPVHEEYRLFCWRGRVFAHPPFPVASEWERQRPIWESIAGRFAGPFVTLDVARREEGGWIVVEAGDGGVSGLPLSIDPDDFYRRLAVVAASN